MLKTLLDWKQKYKKDCAESTGKLNEYDVLLVSAFTSLLLLEVAHEDSDHYERIKSDIEPALNYVKSEIKNQVLGTPIKIKEAS